MPNIEHNIIQKCIYKKGLSENLRPKRVSKMRKNKAMNVNRRYCYASSKTQYSRGKEKNNYRIMIMSEKPVSVIYCLDTNLILVLQKNI